MVMNLQQIEALIAQDESEHLEFKRSTGQRTDAAKTICAGEVTVRFRPTGYVPPTRIGHDLGPLQRQILGVLASIGPAPLQQITRLLDPPAPDRTVQDNLRLLGRLGLVTYRGWGRGARWMLVPPASPPDEPQTE